MSQSPHGSRSARMEAFLDGAYQRILWITTVLGVAATIAATLFLGWRNGLGVALGSILSCLNFIWLHHGSELAIQRMLTAAESRPSRFWLVLAFAGRYVFVIAIAYVILKSYPRVRIALIVGLAFPILAATCEGIYQAVVISNTDQTSD
jgi:hypothetical protein